MFLLLSAVAYLRSVKRDAIDKKNCVLAFFPNDWKIAQTYKILIEFR